MADTRQPDNAPSRTNPDNPRKQQADKHAKHPQNPPVKQVNPDHEGLNPGHLGPGQPRKTGD